MKPRDKVWVFDAYTQEIKKEEVIYADKNGCLAVGHFPGNVFFANLGFDCFPTREALCEHYRRIFENHDRKD